MIQKSIHILGAGPVGSLLAIYMARRGYKVSVYEKRQDPRETLLEDGRSINLALSHRGINALHSAGLEKILLENAIPMKGRMVHDTKGNTNFQPYGEQGQYINSISRGLLNRALIDHAAKEHGIEFFFNEKCVKVAIENNTVEFINLINNQKSLVPYSIIAGSDGAFSQLRSAMQAFPDFSTSYSKLSHGYKELTIPAGKENTHLIEKNALHIWPRGEFMLIALPNTDGSFTCTLFLPFDGPVSFTSLDSKEVVESFFKTFFQDALSLIGTIDEEYFSSEAASLTTVHTSQWVYKDNTFLIGDAAHAIVPFYGQGMNAGFEDVRILNELLDKFHDDWSLVLPEYQKTRKPNADAIAELAMQNFIEMRDLVADETFILRKKIEVAIHKKYKNYLPLYSMVTFSDIPYSEALAKGKVYDSLMKEVLALSSVKRKWSTKTAWAAVEKILKSYKVI